MKKPRTIRLYTHDNDQCMGKKHGEKRHTKAKKMEGKTTDRYPSSSYHCWPTLKEAKKAAKAEYQKWYYLTEFEIEMPVVCKLFDFHYGSETPTAKIIKVYPLVEKS